MRSAFFCIAFVVVALFPSIASAKDSEDSPKVKAEQSPFLPGQIDPQQMQKFIRHFDGNRDGQLDATERLAVQGALEQIKQNPEFAKQLFKQIEQIQPESKLEPKLEMIPAKPRTLEDKILKYLDKDGDGVLTAEEKATAKFTKNPANKSGDEKADEDEDKKRGKKSPADGREGKNSNPNSNDRGKKDPKIKNRSGQNRDEKQTHDPGNGNGHEKSARPEKPNKKDLKNQAEKNKDTEKNKDRWNDKRATDDKQTDGRKPTEKKPHERTSRSKSETSQKHSKNANANANANEKYSGQNRSDGQKTTRSKSKSGSDSHQLVDGRDRPGPSHKSSGPKNGR